MEDADSDFQEDAPCLQMPLSPPLDDDDDTAAQTTPHKKRKLDNATAPLIQELDSGDEATIKEPKETTVGNRNKARQCQRQSGMRVTHESGGMEGRATRAHAEDKEKDEREKKK